MSASTSPVRALLTAPDQAGRVRLAEVAAPVPRDDQALVDVVAVSLNRGEVSGLAGAPPDRQWGWDLAGTVRQAAADGTGPAAGRRVVGLVDRGAWASTVAVPSSRLATIPDQLGFSAAASLPVAGLTAYRTLQQSDVIEGKRVLITGASGGVGRFAIQLASHWGAAVTAVVSHPDRAEGLEGLGADAVVVGVPDEGEFDIVLESVGGASLAAALGLVAPLGIIVTFGNSSGDTTAFDVRQFYPRHGARLQAFRIFPELDRLGSATVDLGALAVLAGDGNLDPQIVLDVPWTQAVDAIDQLLGRSLAGKAVLQVDPG